MKHENGHAERLPVSPRGSPSLPAAPRPRVPSWLSESARKHWPDVLDWLDRAGMLDTADLNIVARYCETWARYIRVSAEAERAPLFAMGGNGSLAAHPAQRLLEAISQGMVRLERELGLSPRARKALGKDKMSRSPGAESVRGALGAKA